MNPLALASEVVLGGGWLLIYAIEDLLGKRDPVLADLIKERLRDRIIFEVVYAA